MSSSSSTSSRLRRDRRSVVGVPTSCWCGRNIITYVSQTGENPFRRFYRCEIAFQRKSEEHLFKWIDEALLDEIRMVETKHMRLVEDVAELRKSVMENVGFQTTMVRNIEEQMKQEVDEKIKSEVMVLNAKIEKMAIDMAKKTMHKVGVTVLFIGAVAWICEKLLH